MAFTSGKGNGLTESRIRGKLTFFMSYTSKFSLNYVINNLFFIKRAV